MKKLLTAMSYLGILVVGVYLGGALWKTIAGLKSQAPTLATVEVVATSDKEPEDARIRVGGVNIQKGQLDLAVILHAFQGEVASLDNLSYRDSGFLVDDALPAKVSENLRSLLLKELVERSLLFRFLQQKSLVSAQTLNNNPVCKAKAAEVAQRYGKTFPDPTMLGALEHKICVQRAVQKHFDENVASRIEIPMESVREYYEQNKEEFKYPNLYTIRQIVTREEIEAKRISYRVKSHSFASFAKEHSITPEGRDGGLMKNIDLQTMPQVFQEIAKMRIGKVSNILKSTYGFHLIMVVSKQKASQKSFDEVKDQIKEKLLEERKKKEYRKWVELALHSVSVGLSSQ